MSPIATCRMYKKSHYSYYSHIVELYFEFTGFQLGEITGVSVDQSFRSPACPGSSLSFSCSGTGNQLEIYSPGVLDGSDTFVFFILLENVGTVSRRGGSSAVIVGRDSVTMNDARVTVNLTLQLPQSITGGNYFVICNITNHSGVEESSHTNYSVIGEYL